MSLSEEEVERLSSIVKKNRGKGSSTPGVSHCATITDETLALVRRGKPADDPVFHAYSDGLPSCGARAEKSYRKWDLETAKEWRRPCKSCYPEGVPE